MSPLIFAPMPLPHHASKLFWFTFVGILAGAGILNHFGAPRSAPLWIVFGYFVGLAYGGDVGGIVGSAAGLLLGLLSARLRRGRGTP